MTLRSLKSDILYFCLLCAFLAAYLTGMFDFAHDFVAAFGHWIWAAYAGLLFFSYPFAQRRPFRGHASTFFILLARLLFLFLLSVVFAVLLGLWLRPQDQRGWQLGAFFLVTPALLVALVAFASGFTTRTLTSRVT